MKHEDLFEKLEPPAGGLTRLRAAMATTPRRALFWVPAVGAPAILAVALVAIGRFTGSASPALSPFVVALSAALSQRGGEPAMLATGERSTMALERVPTENPKVVFYWVASTEWGR